jgi:hypothetical protein
VHVCVGSPVEMELDFLVKVTVKSIAAKPVQQPRQDGHLMPASTRA